MIWLASGERGRAVQVLLGLAGVAWGIMAMLPVRSLSPEIAPFQFLPEEFWGLVAVLIHGAGAWAARWDMRSARIHLYVATSISWLCIAYVTWISRAFVALANAMYVLFAVQEAVGYAVLVFETQRADRTERRGRE